MKRILVGSLVLLLTGCHIEESPSEDVDQTQEFTSEVSENVKETPEVIEGEAEETENPNNVEDEILNDEEVKNEIIGKYEGRTPETWGENVPGVITHIATDEKKIALTFDACIGAPHAYDAELIEFLKEEEIPATLFFGGQWIEAYEEEFMALSDHPLFEVANHGYDHKPLSVTGESAYGIPGTQNVEEVFDEIYYNQQSIKELTGEYPQYFRAGTAYYDEIAVEIAGDLGLKVVNYNVLGDAGATFTKEQISSGLKSAQTGSIYLFHMNHPGSDVAVGVKEGVLALKEQGYEFVQLQEVDHLLK